MGFLQNLENFLNEKAKLVEDTINKSLDDVSGKIDINGMMDQASDKLNTVWDSMNSQMHNNSDSCNNMAQPVSNDTTQCYQGETIPMETTPVSDNIVTEHYTGETVPMTSKPAINLYKETELDAGLTGSYEVKPENNTSEPVKKTGVSLKK